MAAAEAGWDAPRPDGRCGFAGWSGSRRVSFRLDLVWREEQSSSATVWLDGLVGGGGGGGRWISGACEARLCFLPKDGANPSAGRGRPKGHPFLSSLRVREPTG